MKLLPQRKKLIAALAWCAVVMAVAGIFMLYRSPEFLLQYWSTSLLC